MDKLHEIPRTETEVMDGSSRFMRVDISNMNEDGSRRLCLYQLYGQNFNVTFLVGAKSWRQSLEINLRYLYRRSLDWLGMEDGFMTRAFP